MTTNNVERLQQQLAEWREKLAGYEADRQQAGLLALDGAPGEAEALLQRCTHGAEIARQAIATIEERLTHAQALDDLAKAEELSAQAAELDEKATAIEEEIDGIMRMARAIGVNLVRKGAPQVDQQMRAQAVSWRLEAAALRRGANKTLTTTWAGATQEVASAVRE